MIASPPMEMRTRVTQGMQSWQDARERALIRYLQLLAEADSPLLAAGPAVLAQVRRQFVDTLDDAVGIVASEPGEDASISVDIGRTRATTGAHPSESLAAASLIFEAGLDAVAGHLDCSDGIAAEREAALRLNRVILRRMAVAAKSYVEYLLEKTGTAHADEARRLSRDLHDEVGPAIAVGIQGLELVGHYLVTDPTRIDEKVQNVRESLLEGLALVRSLSAEMRLSVAPEELGLALNSYLATVAPKIRTGICNDADLTRIPAHYAREIFLVLREGIRNAVVHGQPSEVTVDLLLNGSVFVGIVTDDGSGFDTTRPRTGTGILSMHERAALLGGTIEVESEPSQTQVVLTVPLPPKDLA